MSIKNRQVMIPDYDVSIGEERPFKIRLHGVVCVIGDISVTRPPEDSDIDNAIFSYTYEIESGKIPETINKNDFEKQLNYIVTDELEKFYER